MCENPCAGGLETKSNRQLKNQYRHESKHQFMVNPDKETSKEQTGESRTWK